MLGEASPLYRRFAKRLVDASARILLILFALIYIYWVALPFYKDVFLVVNGDAPIIKEAYVTSVSLGRRTGSYRKTVFIDSGISPKNNSLRAVFFDVDHIISGKSYRFTYLPYSRFILEAETIDTNP